MKLHKKFSNLVDVNIISQLSNNDLLIASSNKIKIYSSNSFRNLYTFSEIKSPIISINSIHEIKCPKNSEIILTLYLSNQKFQIILLKINSKSKKKYSHKLLESDIEKKICSMIDICINSFLYYLIVSQMNKIYYFKLYLDLGRYKLIHTEKYETKNSYRIKAINSLKYKDDDYIITIEEKNNIFFYLRIYYFQNFELITELNNLNLSLNEVHLSFMTLFDQDKLYLLVGDKNDKILILKLFNDFDIYDEICLTKLIKEFTFNKLNISENYEIKTICGLNDGTFVLGIIYKIDNDKNNKTNYLIRGKINSKNKKFELLEINDNAHNNKSNFITSSLMIKGNNKSNEYFLITGDHEGMLKVWKF